MSPREPNPDRMSCLLQGSDAIGKAIAAARAFGEAFGLTGSQLARLCIVIEELVANLCDHGGLTGVDEVELTFVGEPHHVRVTLVDRAQPFDPRLAPPGEQHPERGGGVGVDIVRAWAQIIGYEVTAEGNRLELLLPLR
jgi:serine/threonine-protein kinase RsbW